MPIALSFFEYYSLPYLHHVHRVRFALLQATILCDFLTDFLLKTNAFRKSKVERMRDDSGGGSKKGKGKTKDEVSLRRTMLYSEFWK